MGLLESIKEDEELLTKETEKEKPEEEKVEEEKEEEPAEEPKEEEEKKEEEPPKDKSPENALAKMRRDLAASEKRARELEEKINEKKEEPKEEAKEQEIVSDVQELILEKKKRDAERHFVSLEENFKATTADYDDVSLQYKTAVYNSMRLQNPRASHQDLLELTRHDLLMKASRYFQKGLDPVQEMYEDAKSLGFKALEKEEEKSEKVEKKSNLDVLAKNKQKSAGMAGAKGRGTSPSTTQQAAIEMPLTEFSQISAEELAQLERGA